jgi:hypothetical protein
VEGMERVLVEGMVQGAGGGVDSVHAPRESGPRIGLSGTRAQAMSYPTQECVHAGCALTAGAVLLLALPVLVLAAVLLQVLVDHPPAPPAPTAYAVGGVRMTDH